MKPAEILQDIQTLENQMRMFEHKYGISTETFYEAYQAGREPDDDAWVQDWAAWASAYKLWLRRREQYNDLV